MEKHIESLEKEFDEEFQLKKYKVGEDGYPIEAMSEDLKDFIRNLLKQQREEHARRINQILNRHSKPLAEGALDYVAAFEEMEKYEHELFRLSPDPELLDGNTVQSSSSSSSSDTSGGWVS
jgi:hypothetical protein